MEHDDVAYVRDLYAARYRRLVGQLVGVTGDLSVAEEVVQDAFMKALERPQAFRRVDNPEAWLRTVAVNAARSRWRRSSLFRAISPRIATPDHLDPATELGEDSMALLAALHTLPTAQREVLGLFYLGDLSLEQVAATLGCPVGTVKARLSRGRAALRPLLAHLDPRAHDHAVDAPFRATNRDATATEEAHHG